MTSAHNLRLRNNIDWKRLCFGEPLPHSFKKEEINREILDGSFQIERLIAEPQKVIQFHLFENNICIHFVHPSQILKTRSASIPVSSSQQLRKINIVKSNIKNALWFSESYGLQPTNVIFHDSLGSSVNLELGINNTDMKKMKEVLFIMDRFKISDQAYHEVATISDTLPKLHSIINIRDNMTNNLEIYKTPGNTFGAYVSLRTELRKMMEKRSNIPENITINGVISLDS
ncbi:unnamed protein product [Mytilus coruscus]|uniref:Uncharacterized protein n=1 Tax=Mytilus coruscus TaxID=42192 RepID=A0A6J8EYA7_MYTCO|nr:unnamed protein product [Mytilus coruscus]